MKFLKKVCQLKPKPKTQTKKKMEDQKPDDFKEIGLLDGTMLVGSMIGSGYLL
jgi:hypothetical protein